MKRILAVGLTVALFGCGASKGTVEEFRSGIPTSDSVALNVPASGGALRADPGQPALKTGDVEQALQGSTAATYQITRAVTVVVNAGTLTVLGILKAVTDQTPSSFDGTTAVWGPYTGSLSPTTWKLTVEKSGDHTYSYTLEGKDKTAQDSAYVVVLSGSHTPALDASGVAEKNFGEGSFLIDWDKAQTLPEHDQNVGTAEFTYARPNATDAATIDVAFRGTRRLDGNGTTDADYHYEATPGQGGAFIFATDADVDGDLNHVSEHLAIKSRWQEGGEGRADVQAQDGDLLSPATLSECWNASFQSTYLAESFDAEAGYGVESTDCAFTSADFPG